MQCFLKMFLIVFLIFLMFFMCIIKLVHPFWCVQVDIYRKNLFLDTCCMKDDSCITNMESGVLGKDRPKFHKGFIEGKINSCVQECTD